jgi:hypothetical protein
VNRDKPPGSLTTTRGDFVCPPLTVVDLAVDPSAIMVPPSTIDVCGSQFDPDRTVLATGVVPGAQGSLL